jgi:hypothetical protein
MQRERNFLNRPTMPASVPPERGIQTQIADLEQERERLEEEVGQLQAAVEIYTEVARRWALDARQQDSPDNERVDWTPWATYLKRPGARSRRSQSRQRRGNDARTCTLLPDEVDYVFLQ